MVATSRLDPRGPKKLLSLDGGGIRGALTIEVLARIETILRRSYRNPDLVLSDWFDYVAGTSTGAILAAALAMGMTTDELRSFYQDSGPAMFDKAFVLKRHRHKYERETLAKKLQEVFGKSTKLGSRRLRCLLMMVMRNATTDSPWPVSNNPRARYNEQGRDDCNLHLPLWQLIRASTAAPIYFPPEEIMIGEHRFLFVDGGVTMFNNPAFQLFQMATLPCYRLGWHAGEHRMLLVSVGTGHAPKEDEDLEASDMHLVYNAQAAVSGLMAAALHEQDQLCRVFGRCLVGDPIDREVGDLKDSPAPGGTKLFTYLRLNAELTDDGLARIGCGGIDPAKVRKLDSTKHIGDLQRIGKAVARTVKRAHFDGFI